MSQWIDIGYPYGAIVKHNDIWWVACYLDKDGLVHGEPGKVRGWEELFEKEIEKEIKNEKVSD